MFTKELICTWFGSSQQFDYVTKLLVVFYIFKTISSATNESAPPEDDVRCLQLLWDCIKSQEFKASIRASYIVSREVRVTEMSLEQNFHEIMTRFVKDYPHLLLNSCGTKGKGGVNSEKLIFDNTLDNRKVSHRYMTQLNQFMVCMKVVYPILPEPEQVNEDEFMEPDWINTILKEFEGINSESQWFEHVKHKLYAGENNCNLSNEILSASNADHHDNKENDEASIPKKNVVNQNEEVGGTLTKKTLVEGVEVDGGTEDDSIDDDEDFISKNILLPSRQKKKKRRKSNNTKLPKTKKNVLDVADTDTSKSTSNDMKRKLTDTTNRTKIVVSNDWYDCFQDKTTNLFSIAIKDLNRSDLQYFQEVATEYFDIDNDRRKQGMKQINKYNTKPSI